MSEVNICACCEEAFPENELTEFNGHLYCEECLDSCTVVCSHCGERIWSEDNAGTDDHPLCQYCYDRNYTHCDHCGMLLNLDDAYSQEDSDETYCYDCFSRMNRNRAIHDYYYKPVPIFHGEGPRYMGVELEIDGGGEDMDNARELLDIANQHGENMYCKHDGSLDDGFELVSHPCTLQYHQTEIPWEDVMHRAVERHYLSHQAYTCGLHVHVSRKAFGDTEEEQDTCIARILYFFEKNWEELLKFSRRTRGQLDRWAARYGYKDQPKEVLETAKKGNLGRYTCVNLCNADTIEFRIFRGTLKYNTLIATLQLVDRICDMALYLTDEEVRQLTWNVFAEGCQKPELVQYLKERRLYVNEPVTAESEV